MFVRRRRLYRKSFGAARNVDLLLGRVSFWGSEASPLIVVLAVKARKRWVLYAAFYR